MGKWSFCRSLPPGFRAWEVLLSDRWELFSPIVLASRTEKVRGTNIPIRKGPVSLATSSAWLRVTRSMLIMPSIPCAAYWWWWGKSACCNWSATHSTSPEKTLQMRISHFTKGHFYPCGNLNVVVERTKLGGITMLRAFEEAPLEHGNFHPAELAKLECFHRFPRSPLRWPARDREDSRYVSAQRE